MNVSGRDNLALGGSALYANTTGLNNVAIGNSASQNNTTGEYNIAIGYRAFISNVIGSRNVVIGAIPSTTAYKDVSNTTMLGYGTYAYEDFGIVIGSGSQALAGSTNSIVIGNNVKVSTPNTIVMGNPNVAYAMKIGTGTVTVNSDKRIKKNIESDVPGLEFIKKLRPVTYHYDYESLSSIQGTADSIRDRKTEIEQEKVIRTGFIAQEVEEAAQTVNYDFDGVSVPQNDQDVYGLNYSTFVVPLVKAVQEQQVQIDELLEQNKEQQAQIAELLERLHQLVVSK